jgi:DNA gyrase subunit A
VNGKTGYVIGVKSVTDEHEVMRITDKGIIIQIRANDVSNIGRITMGVKIMNLDKGSKIVKIAKVRDRIDGENLEEGSEEPADTEDKGEGEDA